MKSHINEIGRFTSKSGLAYMGIFFKDTRAFEVRGPLVGSVGAAGTAFEGTAEHADDAIRQIEEAIKIGQLK